MHRNSNDRIGKRIHQTPQRFATQFWYIFAVKNIEYVIYVINATKIYIKEETTNMTHIAFSAFFAVHVRKHRKEKRPPHLLQQWQITVIYPIWYIEWISAHNLSSSTCKVSLCVTSLLDLLLFFFLFCSWLVSHLTWLAKLPQQQQQQHVSLPYYGTNDLTFVRA